VLVPEQHKQWVQVQVLVPE
jgi:hypothetical protein